MKIPQHAVVILNTKSRRGEELAKQITDILKESRITVDTVFFVKKPKDFAPTFEAAKHHQAQLIIVGGGDGTISNAVNFLADTNKVIGYIPLGTTNNFIRSLKLPTDPIEAAHALPHAKVVTIDVAAANGKNFTNALTIGLAVDVNKRTSAGLKKILGSLAYVVRGIWHALIHKPFTCTLQLDGRKTELTTHQVVVLNGEFHGGVSIDPNSNITDKRLAIAVLGENSRWSHIKALFRLKLYRKKPIKSGRLFYAKKVRITTAKPKHYLLDGEDAGKTPVTVELKPAKLAMLVGDQQ